jgi:hypothetical protein
VRVEKFPFVFDVVILKENWRYRVWYHWLPLGGYVKISGDD